MTPKEKKVIFTLIGVMFIIMVTVIITKTSKGAKNQQENLAKQESAMPNISDFMENAVDNNTDTNSIENTVDNNTNTNSVENTITNDETNNINNNTTDETPNINSNTPSVKTYKTMLITNIEYTKDNVGNKIIADIVNTGTNNFVSEVAKLTLITSTGEQIDSTIIIPSLEAGKKGKLEHLLDENSNNVIDFKIEEI